jgi:tRNA(Ile)-lysidine synthase TilS/MesJ
LNVNEANARILESLRGQEEEEQKVVKELEQEGKLKRIHKKVDKNMKMKNQDRARKLRRFLNKMK